MSANMFSLLAEEPVAATKPAASAAATSSKPVQKALVGGVKKGDGSNRDSSSVAPQQTTKGSLPGEARKDFSKAPRQKHQQRTDANGNPRGREYERHSGTGRPAGENKRGGAGRFAWGSNKHAQADEEAAVEAVKAEEAAPVDGAAVEVSAEAAVETPAVVAEPEPVTKSMAQHKAEKAKAEAALNAALNLGPVGETRKVQAAWYKPEEKKKAAAAPAAKGAAKEQKQVKKVVPVSQIIGEKRQEREDRPFRPRTEGGDRPFRPRTERTEGDRPYQRAEGSERPQRAEGSTGGDRPYRREGGNTRQGGNNRQGGAAAGYGNKKGPKNTKTFDATADADSLPTLGQ